VAETDESITPAGTRSPGHTRSFPRFSAGAGTVGSTPVHFPPKATEPVVQSSARRCMHVHGMLWTYPREINRVLLGSLHEFDQLVAEDHQPRQL
jgi:hypothetical protein